MDDKRFNESDCEKTSGNIETIDIKGHGTSSPSYNIFHFQIIIQYEIMNTSIAENFQLLRVSPKT